MEIKFDMDNFEHSLKQHADEFSMIPSKRVWNGVYNSLNPGSKWPSLSMMLFFLLTLIGIGPLNHTTKLNNSTNSIPENTPASITEDVENVSFTLRTFQREGGAISLNPLEAKVIDLKNYFQTNENRKNINATNNTSFLNNVEHNAPIIVQKIKNKREEFNKIEYSSGNKNIVQNPPGKDINTVIVNMQNYDKSFASLTNRIIPTTKSSKIADKEIALNLKNSNNEVSKESLILLLQKNVGKPVLIEFEEINQHSKNSSETESGTLSKLPNQKKNKTTWIFFATPSISTTYFTGENFENHNSPISSSPLIINPNQVGNSMRFNARLGLNIGTEMNYAFSNGWEIVSGAQISYSGYNILAHKVHPTFSYLYIKDESNTMSPHKYITYYGSGLGLDEVVLHNTSIQFSVPVGVNHTVWKNNNLEIKVGTSVQPSLLLNGQAYILSTDGRNYVNDDDLMRTVNVIGELNSSISFQGDKVKWHVGPVVRYQALSSYNKNYPVNEHLIDYGIRIGISK